MAMLRIRHILLIGLISLSAFAADPTPPAPAPTPAAPTTPAEKPPAASACVVPAKQAVTTCASGSDQPFLCVNTLPGGVKDGFVIIKGSLNLTTSVLGQLTIAAQPEYTKKLLSLQLSTPLTENCWNQNLTTEQNFCLEPGGMFAIRMPLPDLGPYTLFIAATRQQGEPMQATQRISHVIKPTVTNDILSFDPEVQGGKLSKGGDHVKVVLDLLQGCGDAKETCDFIGVSTGGVTVTVRNLIDSTPPKTIQCETSIGQGGAGRFSIGVPVQPGKNKLEIRICNAATGTDPASCPTLSPAAFDAGGTLAQIEVLSPSASDPFLWDAAKNATIPLRFKVNGVDAKSCDDSVHVLLNANESAKICAGADGVYETQLTPEEGYNVAAIEVGTTGDKMTEAVAFGWGKIMSPFDGNGRVRPENDWTLSHALQISLSEGLLNKTVLPLLQKFLGAPNFNEWLASATADVGRGPKAPTIGKTGSSVNMPAYCSGGALTNVRIKITTPPHIGKISVGPFGLAEGSFQFPIHAEDVSAGIQIYKDANGDGVPDEDPLPLKISFKQVEFTPMLKTGWKLSSPYTDCDYKREGGCTHMPALLVPGRYVGNASAAGAFVVCDPTQKVSPAIELVCRALNTVDRQTGGFFQEKLLDTVNSVYACDAAQALTDGFSIDRHVSDYEVAGSLAGESLDIHSGGMQLAFKTRFGSRDLLEKWSDDLRKRGAGIVVPTTPVKPLVAGIDDIAVGVALPMISQVFWGVQGSQGDVSLKIDDAFFKKQGFNFAERCDQGGEPPTLCKMRPRAQEIFGSVISDYGYLDPKAPLRLIFTPSQAFPLRLNIIEEGVLRVEFANWKVAFESETDSTRFIEANLSGKIDMEISKPILMATDPDNFMMSIKMRSEKSRIWMQEVKGTNTTLIPSSALLYQFKTLMQFAVDNYAKEGNKITIPISRTLDFSTSTIALPKLVWGPSGLNFGWDAGTEAITIEGTPVLQ